MYNVTLSRGEIIGRKNRCLNLLHWFIVGLGLACT